MSKKQQHAQRLLRIADRKAKRRYPNGTKDQQLIYQLGLVVGMLSKYAVNDMTIRQDLRALEQELGIVYKE